MLENIQEKATELNVELTHKRRKRESGSESDSDDDDFVEVPTKEGYEAGPPSIDPVLGIPFYPTASKSAAANSPSTTRKPKSKSETEEPKPGPSGLQLKKRSDSGNNLSRTSSSSSGWRLDVSKEEEADPTTFAATLSKLKVRSVIYNIASICYVHRQKANSFPKESAAGPSRSTSTGSGGGDADNVPRLPFDVDLMNWGEKRAPRQVVIDSERLRFWGGTGRDEETMVVPGSDSNERTIEFTGTYVTDRHEAAPTTIHNASLLGKFEPVKWSCRAPLPSGRLCPRRDRFKCPLHGKVIPRDNMGQPANAEDRLAEEQRIEDEKNKNPDWQDPQLLKDLKAATGVDLKVPEKGKRRRNFYTLCLLS